MKKLNYLCLISMLLLIAYSCTKNENNQNTNPVTNYSLRLTGSVQTCNGNNLTNGSLVIYGNNGSTSIHLTNSSFDTTLHSYYQFDSIMVWAVDLESLTTSDTLLLAVSGDNMNLGQISTCADSVDEYIKCNINNESFVFVPNFLDTLDAGGSTTISLPTTYFYRQDGLIPHNSFYHMQFDGIGLGTFSIGGNSEISIGRYFSFNMPASGSVTYTSYGNVGDYITGTLNVPFVDNTDSLSYLLTGSFKVRRDH